MPEKNDEQRIDSTTMAAIHDSSHAALLRAIRSTTEAVASSNSTNPVKAETLERLALAYRYAMGGAQPGSVVVKK